MNKNPAPQSEPMVSAVSVKGIAFSACEGVKSSSVFLKSPIRRRGYSASFASIASPNKIYMCSSLFAQKEPKSKIIIPIADIFIIFLADVCEKNI